MTEVADKVERAIARFDRVKHQLDQRGGPVQAAARNLLGWVGRVVARGGTAGPDGSPGPADTGDSTSWPDSPVLPITCEGEGVVLFEVEREREGGRSV